MADDLDHELGRLAPAVDTDRAHTAFRARRRRSKAMRRGALGAAAACVVVAGTVGVLAAREDDTPVTAGPGGSGGPAENVPRVWAHEPTGSPDGMDALIAGVLAYQPELDCLLLGGGVEPSFPIVWPAGTTGTADGPGVVLPSGDTARVGDIVEGGGGFLGREVAEEHGIPESCLPPSGQVAAFNPNEDVSVSPDPSPPDPQPTCGDIERFADRLVDTGIAYDYDPSESPEALLADVDLVIYGTLTDEFRVQPGTDDGESYVTYSVEVLTTYKGPSSEVVPVSISFNTTAFDEEATPFEEAIADGAPVVAFAYAEESLPGPGFVAAIEGFATGCPGEPIIGRVGDSGSWRDVTDVDDLVARLEAAVAP